MAFAISLDKDNIRLRNIKTFLYIVSVENSNNKFKVQQDLIHLKVI